MQVIGCARPTYRRWQRRAAATAGTGGPVFSL